MATTGQGLFCITCQRQTMHVQAEKVNHVMHFLLGWLTCTVWWFVWLWITLAHKPKFACATCGTAYDHLRATTVWKQLNGQS